MKLGYCPDCKRKRLLTKHSLIGEHKPPFVWICRDCHDLRHYMENQKEERQIAREYFQERGLTYSDIQRKDIEKLRELIKYELQSYLPTTTHSRSMDMRISNDRKKDFKFNKDGTLKYGGIYVDGSYFNYREGVFFNEDKFIGFCGWADGSNKMPIINAFNRWCFYLFEKKQSKLNNGNDGIPPKPKVLGILPNFI